MKTKTFKIVCVSSFSLFAAALAAARAQPADTVTLPRMSVYSSRVALQEPSAGSFAMPVSALGFEPLADVQARNMGEAQADVTLRGGIFENTGFRVGAVPLFDAQTGHYSAEIPIAPAMLGAPEIVTGADNALRGWNANAGSVAYTWKRIATVGAATAAGGNYGTWRGEIYQGWVAPETARVLGRRLAFDASAAWAESDGSRPWGESRFSRYNLRAQLASPDGAQTDLVFGRQQKFIGWPNLYTPYANVFETDDLQTTLAALNHRQPLGSGDGDYFAAAVAWRRNKDHYVFNRDDPGAYNPAFATGPAWHTTDAWSAGAETRVSMNQIHLRASAVFVADELRSTALIHGRFNTRSYFKAALAPERTWTLGGARTLTARAGLVFDDTNRDGSAWSPLVSLELAGLGGFVNSVGLSWNKSSQVPTYTALNSRASAGLFRGNPNLGRENSANFEITAHAGRGAWTVDATAFYRRDDDLVDWVYNSGLPNARVANAVDAGTLGCELVARYSAGWGDVVLGYAALSKDADYAPAGTGVAGTADASFYALNYARHRVTLALVARPARGVELRLDNEARWQAANALRRSGNDALLTAAGVFWTVPGIRGTRLFAQITNAWNSDFEEVPAVPAARRQWCAGLAAAW